MRSWESKLTSAKNVKMGFLMDSDREFYASPQRKENFPNSTHHPVKRLEKHRFESKLTFASDQCEFWYELFERAHFDKKLLRK